jgi:hypothetical protein
MHVSMNRNYFQRSYYTEILSPAFIFLIINMKKRGFLSAKEKKVANFWQPLVVLGYTWKNMLLFTEKKSLDWAIDAIGDYDKNHEHEFRTGSGGTVCGQFVSTSSLCTILEKTIVRSLACLFSKHAWSSHYSQNFQSLNCKRRWVSGERRTLQSSILGFYFFQKLIVCTLLSTHTHTHTHKHTHFVVKIVRISGGENILQLL